MMVPEPIPARQSVENAVVRPAPTIERAKPSALQQILQGICVITLAIASYFGISRFLVQSVEVEGSSMFPTLQNSEHYLLNRWVLRFRDPKRADVVVIRDPSASCFAVKRVIGIGGDSVFLKNGKVYVNGQKLVEPYLEPGTPTFAYGQFRDQLICCGKDQYFLLGDNRMNSADSRTYGPVARENILGLIVR
jgi:signal peptidase I